MRKLFYLGAALAIFSCSSPVQEGFIINGTVSGDSITTGKVYLANFSRVEQIRDTAEMVDGKFEFKGNVTTPEAYAIMVEGVKGRVTLFLENDSYKINVIPSDIVNSEVKGGKTNELLAELKKGQDEINKKYQMDSLIREYYNKETKDERKAEIVEISRKAEAEVKALDSAFFANNPTNYYTLNQFVGEIDNVSIEEADAKLAAFDALPEFTNNRNLKTAKESLELIKSLQPGMKAPDFAIPTPNGDTLALSQVYPNNKLTMIDFWAGWCGPCRRFNPTLVEIYKKYKDHGFGILGVSLDKDKENWMKAIEDDKLTWPQVSDLKYWDSDIAKLYHVRYIPQNIFVNQEGIIVKRKVGEEEMVEFIEEQLSK